MIKVSFRHARDNFETIVEQATAGETIIIKRRSHADIALVAASELSGLAETIHILSSPANAKRVLTAPARATGRS